MHSKLTLQIKIAGDLGHDMYFISQGVVQVCSKSKVIKEIGEGHYFGEIALFVEAKRTASVKALTYCEIFVLGRKDLQKVLKDFPQEGDRIQQMAEITASSFALKQHIVRKEGTPFENCSESFLKELRQLFHAQV